MKYRPVNVLPADWDRVKDFCHDAVLTYGPANAKIAAEMLSTVTLFVLWATREERAPLDYAGVFHPALMGRYLRSRVSNKSSSAYKSLHSRLFRIANAVADVDHNRKKRGRYAVAVHEYSARELADLESWAGAHRTPERRQQARTVFALMGGAGLWTKEALAVRESDILTGTEGHSIRVGGRNARVVPVLSDFARYLSTRVASSDSARFVLFPDGSNEETRASSLRQLYRGAHPAPNPQWLRDTWMLRQLRALPISIVMRAAGMPDVSTLRRYLPDASLPYSNWESALRNPAAYEAGMDSPCDDISVSGDDIWRAAYGRLRDEVASVIVKLRDQSLGPVTQVAVEPENAGNCGTAVHHAETPTTDSTAIPAGTVMVPFKRGKQTLTADSTAIPAATAMVPFERAASPASPHDGRAVRPAGEADNAPGSIKSLEADRMPKPPQTKSRYESLPPGVSYVPAVPTDLLAASAENQPDAAASKFEALRAEMLAEARRSARDGKR